MNKEYRRAIRRCRHAATYYGKLRPVEESNKCPSGLKRNHLAIHLHVNGRTVLTGNDARAFCRAFKRPPGGLGKFCFRFKGWLLFHLL